MAAAAVTTRAPPGSTTPVMCAGFRESVGSSPTSEGRTESTSCMMSGPMTVDIPVVMAVVATAARASVGPGPAVVDVVSESNALSTTAATVASAAAPITPATNEARLARRRRRRDWRESNSGGRAGGIPSRPTSDGWRHNRSSGASQPR